MSALVNISFKNFDILYAGLFVALTMIRVPGLCIFIVALGLGAIDVKVSNFLFVILLMIKFTCEMEIDQQIAYLDMKIQRDMNHTISTCYYQKPTCKNRLLNFHSAHPITQKSGVAFGTISRVLTLSSSKYRNDNIKTIYDILGMNGYPKQLIGNLINKFDNKRKDLCMDIYTNRIAKKYRGMIHIPELTESFDKLFKKYDPDIQIGYKPWKTIGNITKNKNINNKDDDNTHAVVYSFECNDCDGIYIGQTGQRLKNRIHQHKAEQTKKQPKNNMTASLQHVIETGHTFNLENTKVVINERHLGKRLTLEALNINLEKSRTINLKSDIDSLNPVFVQLLKHIKYHK